MRTIITYWDKRGRRLTHRFGANVRVLGGKIAWDKFYKAKLRVSYGKRENCWGKLVEFVNEGIYFNRKDLQQAFRAFIEAGR
jgi:hypothetical protein